MRATSSHSGHSLYVDNQHNERSFLDIYANVANEVEKLPSCLSIWNLSLPLKPHHKGSSAKAVRNLIVLLNLPNSNPRFINVRYFLPLNTLLEYVQNRPVRNFEINP